MNPDDLRRLQEAGSEAKIRAGRVLLEKGQHGTGVYVLLEGTVIVEAPEGEREFGPGSVLGERALLAKDGKRSARVRAATDLRVVAVGRSEVDQLCTDDPAFAQRLAEATS